MALDPLKFQVAIQDEATGQLDKIEKEFNKLKDKTINVKVEGIQDLQRLLQLLGQQSAPKIGDKVEQEANKAKDAAKKVGDAAQTTSEQIQKLAQSAIKGSFEQFVNDLADVKKAIQNDNFTAFSKRISECAESITKMTEAFSAFKVVISDNKELKDLLTGWGAAMKEVSAAIKTMNAVKNGSTTGTTQKEDLRQTEAGLVKVADALGRVRNAASGGSGGSSVPFLESITRVGEGNIQTLIKEQGHIERLIQIAEKGIKFGEGHDVAGMQGLRVQMRENLEQLLQYRDVLKNILYQAQNGNQGIIHWLNQSGALRTTPFGKDAMGNDVTLLGGHFDQLTHSVTGTSTAMRQLNMEMRLDNADKFKQWNTEKLTEGLHKVNQAIADIRTSWDKASGSADADMTRRVAEQVNRLHDIRAKILSAMGNNETLRTPRGYQQVINANNNEQINQAKRLRQELDGISRAEEKQAKDAERYTEQQKRAYEKAEKDKVAAIEKARKVQEQAARQAQQDQNTQERNQQRINGVLQGTIALFDRLANARTRGENLGVDTSLAERKLQQLEMMQNRVLGFSDFGNNHAVQMLIGEWNALQRELRGVASAQEKVNNVQERADKKDAADSLKQQVEAAKQAQKENEKWAESSRRAGVEVTNLEIKIRKLKEVEAKGSAVGVDTTALKQQIALLEQYLTTFRQMASGSRGYGFAVDLLKDVGYQSATIRAKDEAQAVRNNTAEKERNAAATSHMSSEEQRLAQALNQTTNAARGQNQVLSDLKSMAAQYLSVYAAQSFLQEMANITGELELQKRSLEVIISSAEYANQLYNDIRDLSQQSPYTFQDLLKSTRQLAAFGVETKDLYDTMKALSDIGAGLSVDVQRLILAFGHTRSYGYLSGIQNRQFETAGIDLVGALAERYNKLAEAEERAGRAAERVTRKDVFKMISKKDVSFEDVQAVIMDLDREGGRFYNMQERQYDTLGGKLRNLRNNYNIMMSEMGESNMGVLRFGVDLLNELTANWDKYAHIIGAIVIPLGAYRIAMLATNTAIGRQSTLMAKNVMAMVRGERAVAAMNAAYRKGFWGSFASGWKSQGFTPNRADAKSFANTLSRGLQDGSLNKSNLMYMGLSRELPKRYREIALALAGVDKGQIKTMISANGLQRAWYKAKIGAAAFGASLRSLFAATLANPMTWVLAAISAVTAAFEHVKSISDEAARIAKDMRENAVNDQKEIQDTFERHTLGGVSSRSLRKYEYGGYIINRNSLDFDEGLLRGQNLVDAIEEMKRKLQAFSPMYDGDLVDIYKMNDQYEQFKTILQKLEDLRFVKDVQEATANGMENAIEQSAGGNWFTRIFGDSVTTNIKEFSDAMRASMTFLENNLSEMDLEVIKEAFPDLQTLKDIQELYKRFVSGNREAWTEFEDVKRKLKTTTGNELLGVDTVGAARGTYNQYHQMVKDMESTTKHAASVLQSYFKSGDKSAATTYLEDYIKQLMTAASVADPETQQMIMQAFLDKIQPLLAENGMGDLTDEVLRKMVMSRYMKLIDGEINEDTTVEDLDRINKEVSDKVITWGKGMAIDMHRIGLDSAEAFKDGLNAAKELAKPLEAWQIELRNAMQVNGRTVYSDFYNQFKRDIKESDNLVQLFGERMKKQHDDYAKQIEMAFPYLRKIWNIEIAPDFKINTENLEKLKQLRDSVQSRLDGILNSGFITKEEKDAAKQQLQPILNQLNGEAILLEEAQKYGFTYGNDKKDKGGSGSKSYKDEFAKRWDERIRIMKEAYDWYDKWEKKVGRDAALAETNSKYADIFNEWKTDNLLPMDFDVKDIADYTKYVEKIRDEALKRYQAQKNDKSKNNGQEALRVYRQAVALLNDVRFDNFTRAAERFKSLIEKAMDDLQRKWDVFNEVRTITGSKEIAANILGIDGQDETTKNTADATRKLIETAIGNMGDAVKVPIQFDVNMSDMQIKDMVTAALGGTEYQEQIDSVVDAIKKWRDLQRNVIKDDILSYAKLIGSAVDYKSQVEKINDELERQKEQNARLVEQGIISQSDADRANQIAKNQADDKKWKLSLQYITLMNSSLAMTRDELTNGVNMAMAHLNALLKQNLITAKDYADEMERLRKIQSDWDKNALFGENNGLTSFLKGGWNGLESFYQRRIHDADQIIGSTESTQAQKDEAEKNKVADEKTLTSLQNFQNGLSGVALVSEAVMGAFDGVQKAAMDLSRMFDALGNEGAANFWSDFSDTVGGISAIFAPVNNIVQSAMSGNIGGLVSSAITAPVSMITGPITAFSQLHDKRIERAINKLREDVQRIEANTKLIKQARERTLGFDTGNVRQSYQQKYAGNDQTRKYLDFFTKEWKTYSYKSAAQKAMYAYYGSNSSGNGYQQEYNNLLKERQDYMDMYNREESKKKSSAAALEEYKAKIAELDEQIRYFTMDLAKELFSIDIKGWADQLSDALASAFENGENVAKAYKETVTNILQQVMSKMMQMAILEPMFQSLQDKLFGNAEKNISGVFDVNNPKGSMKAMTAMITDFFGTGGEGEKTITAAMEFMTAFQRGLENAGLTVLNDTSNTLSSSVQGTSEETSDLLAGYVNALRQDVAVNRILLSQFVTELWPSYIEQVANAVRSLNNIDTNVAFILALLSENGALYTMIESMKSHFDGITNGNESVRIQ